MTVYATCGQQPAARRRRAGHRRERRAGAAQPYRDAAAGNRLQDVAARRSTSQQRGSGSSGPFANLDPADNVFRISGDQLNYGVEAMVTGRVGTRLVTYGGFTVLDPKYDRHAGARGRQQALRRHPGVEVEPADGISRAPRVAATFADAQLATGGPSPDRRCQHRVHAGVSRRRSRRAVRAGAEGRRWRRGG